MISEIEEIHSTTNMGLKEKKIIDVIERELELMDQNGYEPHKRDFAPLMMPISSISLDNPNSQVKARFEELTKAHYARSEEYVSHYLSKAEQEVQDLEYIKRGTLPSLDIARRYVDERTRFDFSIEKNSLLAKLEINQRTLNAGSRVLFDITETGKNMTRNAPKTVLEYQNRIKPSIVEYEKFIADKMNWSDNLDMILIDENEDLLLGAIPMKSGRFYNYENPEFKYEKRNGSEVNY